MPYNKGATRQALELTGLASNCREFANRWFDGWEAGQLPLPETPNTERLEPLSRLVRIRRVSTRDAIHTAFPGAALIRIARAAAATMGRLPIVPNARAMAKTIFSRLPACRSAAMRQADVPPSVSSISAA